MTEYSIGEVADRALMVIREAVGFAEPQPEDRLRENELQIVPLVEAQISEGFARRCSSRSVRSS